MKVLSKYPQVIFHMIQLQERKFYFIFVQLDLLKAQPLRLSYHFKAKRGSGYAASEAGGRKRGDGQ